ncbi:hypothetical protein ACB098_01G056600 [Castanea mollissima]
MLDASPIFALLLHFSSAASNKCKLPHQLIYLPLKLITEREDGLHIKKERKERKVY